jgi:hypothetical protein
VRGALMEEKEKNKFSSSDEEKKSRIFTCTILTLLMGFGTAIYQHSENNVIICTISIL